MVYAGLLVTLLGFLISILSLNISTAVGVRMAIVLIGLAVSLFGILGLINPAFQKKTPWRKS
jgi:hypothetical protein